MRKLVVLFLLLFSFFAVFPQPAIAAPDTCVGFSDGFDVVLPYYKDGNSHTIQLSMAGSDYDPNTEYFFTAHHVQAAGLPGINGGTLSPRFKLNGSVNNGVLGEYGNISINNGVVTWKIDRSQALSAPDIGTNNIYVTLYKQTGIALPVCQVGSYERSDDPSHTEYTDARAEEPFKLCEQINDADLKAECQTCFEDTSKGLSGGIWTAIGCLPTRPQGIITALIRLGLSVGGGAALLLILAGAFRLSVSQGEPKQAEEAREQITSAVIGLLFVIFSIAILRFIGVNLLQIPGFGGS